MKLCDFGRSGARIQIMMPRRRHRHQIPLRWICTVLVCLLPFRVSSFVPSSVKLSTRELPRSSPCLRHTSCFAPRVKSLTTKSITSTSHLAAISIPASFPSSQSLVAWWYLSLLAILFGTQPFFQKKYVPKTICRSSVVLAQEVTKVATAASLLWASGGWAKATASELDRHDLDPFIIVTCAPHTCYCMI